VSPEDKKEKRSSRDNAVTEAGRSGERRIQFAAMGQNQKVNPHKPGEMKTNESA